MVEHPFSQGGAVAREPNAKHAEAHDEEPEVLAAEPDEPTETDEEHDEDALSASDDTDDIAAETVRSRAPSLLPIRAGADGLAGFDPLQRYIDEIRRYPLISREEEHDLAVQYREAGDVDAAARLVTANLRLVVKIAHEYRRAYRNLLDLIQEGNLGLMQAVKKYDPYKNVKLSSYAAWWIRAYILKYILNNFRLVRVGTTQAQRKLFFNLRKEQERLEAMGIEVSPKLLADNLSVKEEEVREMQERLAAPEFSLDAPLDSGDGERARASHVDLLPDQTPRAEERVANAEFQGQLSALLVEFAKTLNEKERVIYERRLVAEEPMTLQELGDNFGVSRERARQLEKRIIEKARVYFQQHLGQDFELAVPEDR
jgi:RNA polymerase sigma-32 factor